MKHLTPAEMAACKAVAMTPQERAAPIIVAILIEANVTEAELASDIRTKRVAAVRQIVMTALYDRGFTLIEIGGLLGRDHTTVLAGIRAARARAAESAPVMFKSRRAA